MIVSRLGDEEELPFDLLLTADPSKRLIDDYCKRGFTYILKIEDNIIGTLVLLPTRPDTIEIVNIAIDEKEQGLGYGKYLLNFAIEEAIREDFRTVEIGTANSSLKQLSLYQKIGFKISHIDKDFFIRHYEEPIFENNIQCVDMIRLYMDIK